MDSREKAILKTLLYSNFFDYPLRIEEIYKFLITDQKIDKAQFHKSLQKVKSQVKTKDGFYFLSGRNELVQIRKEREKVSLGKMQKTKKIISVLSLIPTIKLIGVSGTLSMKNSTQGDDIDIFVITKKGFIWTTRMLMIIILLVLGVYRTKNSKAYSDKICLNMLVDENSLRLEKNLYIAHEIAQLVPVFERENAYRQFLQKNNWVDGFMINALSGQKDYLKKESGIIDKIFIYLFGLFAFEKIAKFFQLSYMKKNITTETVEDNVLRLHPFDYGSYILEDYDKKINLLPKISF